MTVYSAPALQGLLERSALIATFSLQNSRRIMLVVGMRVLATDGVEAAEERLEGAVNPGGGAPDVHESLTAEARQPAAS